MRHLEQQSTMKPFLLIVIAIIFNFTASYAQKDPELSAALSKISAASTLNNTLATLNLTSPRLIKAMGGKENALKRFKKSMEGIHKDNVKIDSVINYTDREITTVKNIEYCFFPQLIIFGIPDSTKKMISYSTLMAIKEPAVKGWTFLDYSGLNDEKLNFGRGVIR